MSWLWDRGARAIAVVGRACASRAAPRVVAASLLLAASSASAQCHFVGPPRITFGAYTPFGPAVHAIGEVRYRCGKDDMQAWLGISTPRLVSRGADSLAFELFQDAGHTVVWPSTPPVPQPGLDRDNVVIVYAEVPALQDAAAGSYRGEVTVRLDTGAPGNLTDTRSLDVVVEVPDACVIDPGTLAFGGYDPGGAAPLDGAGSISIACTRGTAYRVGLGPGSFAAGTRQMAFGAARLQYELYTDAGRTTPWSATTTVAGTSPSSARVVLPVFGRIPAGQAVVAGPYADTVQSTIDF